MTRRYKPAGMLRTKEDREVKRINRGSSPKHTRSTPTYVRLSNALVKMWGGQYDLAQSATTPVPWHTTQVMPHKRRARSRKRNAMQKESRRKNR